VGIIAMLVYAGIEITEGLGWLTPQDWLDDLLFLLAVFGIVIAIAIVVACIGMGLIRLFKKEKTTDWSNIGSDTEDK
jgi:hypothetical protein